MKKATLFLLIFSFFLTIPVFASPFVGIGTYEQWERALSHEPGQNYIRPLRTEEWDRYWKAWQLEESMVEGERYPQTNFLELGEGGLYVSRAGLGGEPELDIPGAGLVMAWGDDAMPPGSFASAWVFAYGEDPDLSGKTISITVFPPMWGQAGQITQVSFGMRDVNGNIRSWYWNCGPNPGQLPWNMATTITIDTDMIGLGATNPPATGFLNTPLFDITKVIDFIVDENAVWVGGPTPVPPDGVNIGRIWNYWKDLKVLPKDKIANKGYYVKYSQPAFEIEPGIILGWDEKSVYRSDFFPIMADDFLCKDDRPITDFHWWGSFLGWNEPGLPPIVPEAFHIAIWTDVPDPNPDDPTDWSKPGKMVWEHVCKNWVWNFAGFDRHPLENENEQFKNEACFQFNQLLSEPDWFKQEPGENVYWLSISAIYSPNVETIRYPWGWKTRPHKFNDPAFRIKDTFSPDGTISWPPHLGNVVNGGNSVLINEFEPWDLAFEITTNLPAYHDNPIPGDIDRNGIVDLLDFAQLAKNWLETAP